MKQRVSQITPIDPKFETCKTTLTQARKSLASATSSFIARCGVNSRQAPHLKLTKQTKALNLLLVDKTKHESQIVR